MLSKIHVSARPFAALIATAFACLFAPTGASALTAKELTDRMSNDQQASYITGVIDTMQFYALQSGDTQKSKCIFDAYFQGDGSKGDAWSKLYVALHQFPDRQTTDIIYLLAKKSCGG